MLSEDIEEKLLTILLSRGRDGYEASLVPVDDGFLGADSVIKTTVTRLGEALVWCAVVEVAHYEFQWGLGGVNVRTSDVETIAMYGFPIT